MAVEHMHSHCAKCDKQVLMERTGTNHILHLLLSFVTLGFWVIIWILSCVKIGGWKCTICGGQKSPNAVGAGGLLAASASIVLLVSICSVATRETQSELNASKTSTINHNKESVDSPVLVHLDGYENGELVATEINIWRDYNDRSKGIVAKLKHGQEVVFLKRISDGVLVESKNGLSGWVTYYFIKEFK